MPILSEPDVNPEIHSDSLLKQPKRANVDSKKQKLSILAIVALLSVGTALSFSPLSSQLRDLQPGAALTESVSNTHNAQADLQAASTSLDVVAKEKADRSQAELSQLAPAAPAVAGRFAQEAQKPAQDKLVNGELPPLDAVVSSQSVNLGQGYNAPGYLIKTAHLQLEAEDIQQAFGRVTALTDKYQGYLVSSNLSNYAQGSGSASLQIKLPSHKLSAALAELDTLGTVRSKQITTEDLWLQLQQQRLETEYLQDQATQTKTSTPSNRHQIKLQQLERLRLEQSLKMATLELQLTQKPAIWNLQPLGQELGQKAQQSLTMTARLLADVLLFVPPLLVFLGLAWLGWLVLGNLLITRLGLIQERLLAKVYLLGLVFFPLYSVGGLGAAGAFSVLLGLIWSAGLVAARFKKRTQPAPAQVIQPEV